MSTDIKVHKAVVHASDGQTGIVYVKIPAVTGQKIVKVSKEGLTQSSLGAYNVPKVGDLCLVALSRDNSDVSWVSGLTADLYRADVDGVIEAINAWQTGNIQINQPGALATDLIVSRHILAGQIITDKLAANAITTPKLATDAITSLNFSWVRSLPANAGSIAFNSRTLTVAGADFRSSDVGRTVYIPNGGAASAAFYTTISSRSSASVVTLTDPCLNGSGVSGATVQFTTPPTGGYSDVGSFLDLGDGDLRTPGVYAEGITGNISIRGNVTASSLTMVDLSGRPTAFLAEDSSTVRSFKMVTSENSALKRPRLQWTFVPGFPLPDIGTSLVLGYFTTDTGSTRSNSIEIWDGAAFVTHDMVLTAPKAKFTGTLDIDGTSLQMSSASNSTLYFGSATLGDKISFYNYTGNYAMGIAASTLYYNSDGNHDFRVGGNLRTRISSSSIGANGQSIIMGSWNIDGSWTGSVYGSCGYLLMGYSGGVANPIYLRTNNTNPVYIGANGSNTLSVGNGTSTFSGTVTSGIVNATNTISSSWDSAGLQSNGSGSAGISIHPGTFAVQFRQSTAGGDKIYLRNSTDSGYAIMEGDMIDVSNSMHKQDIVTWDSALVEEGVPDPLDAVRLLRPVFYRNKYEERIGGMMLPPRRQAALERLNAYKDSKGDPHHDVTHETTHLCGRDCWYQPWDPCEKVRDWQAGWVGLIAEEVGAVMPSLATLDVHTGDYTGLKALSVAALGVAANKKLLDMVEKLTARVESLEQQLQRVEGP